MSRNYQPSKKYARNTSWSGSSKKYLPEREQGQSYLEDPQLAKLVNRVMREDERDRRLSACRQLKDYIFNSSHVQKFGLSLAQELSRILFDRTSNEVKREISICTALLASDLGKDLQNYLRWLFRKYSSTGNEEAQAFLLHSVLQLMKFGEDKESFTSVVLFIMEEIQSALETTESQQLLIAIVDIVLIIAERYSDVFESHFRDTVDILVGWHIDPSQSEPIITYTSEALISFHQYWVADISFSVTLLGQFLEDMEAYSDVLGGLNKNQKVEDDHLPEKISSLLRAYTTVIKSLKHHFNPGYSTRITASFVTDNFSRLLVSLLKVINTKVSDIFLVAANECIGLLLSHMKDSALPFLQQISTLTDVQMPAEASTCLPDKQAFSLLGLATHVVMDINNRLPPEFIGKILGPESIFPKMRLWPSNKIREQVLELYRSVFRLKTVPLLEEAYRYIFTDLQMAFSCLLDLDIENSQYLFYDYDKDQALNCSIFDLCAIAEIGNNKHSLIAMLAFHPSIFDLLTIHLRPSDSNLALNYSNLQYAILFTLYSHCANHGYFITTSSCLSSIEVTSADRHTTSNHFTSILDLISQLLTGNYNSWDVRYFVVKWSRNMVVSSDKYLEQISTSSSFIRLIHSLITFGFSTFETDLARYIADVLSLILRGCWWKLPVEVLTRCFELSLMKMADFNDGIRLVYERLFDQLPLGIILKNPNTILSDTTNFPELDRSLKVNGIRSMYEDRRRLQSRNQLGIFSSQDLRAVFDFILLGRRPKNKWDWLVNMFVANQRGKFSKNESDQSLTLLNKSHQGVVWFWSTYEAALFCVLSKLRTPLGKPQDTLATIEVAVKNFTAEVLNQPITSSEVAKLSGSSENDWIFAHLRVKLLLDLMEQLEKMMYNAYEGCAVSLSTVPKVVKAFFRTNKTTCQEWLSRVRRAAITLSLQFGHPSFAVRNSFHLVKAMHEAGNTQENDFNQAVFLLIQALVCLNSPDAILGVYQWLKQEVGVKMAWIKPAVDMASGRYEDAAHEFNCVLQSETAAQVTPAISNFMKNKIIESLRCLGSWDEICRWIKTEETKWSNCEFPSELNIEHIQKMADFDLIPDDIIYSDFDSASEATSSTVWNLQSRVIRQNAESSAVDFLSSSGTGTAEKLQTESSHLSSLIRLGLMEAPLNLPVELVALNHVIKKLDKDEQTVNGPQLNFPLVDGKDIPALVQAARWLPHVTGAYQTDSVIKEIHLVAARTARKNQNIQMAQRYLMLGLGAEPDEQPSVSSIINRLKTADINLNVIDAQLCREATKLLHRLNRNLDAAQILSSKSMAILVKTDNIKSVELKELTKINAKSILTLVNWIQADSSVVPAVSNLVRNGQALNGFRNSKSAQDDLNENEVENLVNRLLWTATKQCPTLAKAWFELASWCYKSGKKAVDHASESGIELTSDEVNQISTLLSKDTNDGDIELVRQLLSRVRIVEGEDNLENHLDANYRQRILSSCSSLSDTSVDDLLVIWESITERVYCHYRTACEAYFTFLQLNGSSCDLSSVSESPDEDANATATLRLLRMMVKHATELRNVFENGLTNTPVEPWKGIILQLFARLNHPEPYVRRSISDLLCRITVASPHLIIFPAVVGSSAIPSAIKNRSGVLGECLSQVSDDPEPGAADGTPEVEVTMYLADISDQQEEEQEQAAMMQNCFAAMVETLAKHDPKSVAEVQRLVHELRRITLLWDELWLGTLSQYHLDFNKRIIQLEKEINKVKDNTSLTTHEKTNLIIKKHRAFLKPTIFILEQLQTVTSQLAETPHEKWFQDTFGQIIQDSILKLKTPTNPDQPQLSGQVYKQLLYNLQQKVQKRSSSVLNMLQISPTLASMKSTGIAMPVTQLNAQNLVTIEAIDNVVSILPTKTKPKKLVFYGNDGKRYPFLFKGLEDLHLDERIMQLLTIVNNMFMSNRSKLTHYRARHYSVTPLGPRSGLIQWVERATPLFGLYKRWQQREATALANKSNTGNNTNNNQGVPIRPSEIYYNKLTPLLKEQGIVNLGNRKEWPLSVMCRVLLELTAETPSDLLAKELWCASTSAHEWWTVTETYARSVAVMSVIGYIIGLGDRHLDNVLVDLSSGEVIHIDYNVCFEKGKNLRVPERVPFRMTPNIKTALGLTGVEGTFRVSCEHVLKTIRRGRETLLTLLEAFVYDPLIDWTPGSEGGYTGAVYGGWQGGATSNLKHSKQEMECSLLDEMFHIRMTEMKSEWLKNREEILETLPKLESLLHNWIEAHHHLQSSEEELQELHQQIAVLKEAEANPLHSLHSLPQRCGDYLLTKELTKAARCELKEKLSDCERWHLMHKSGMEAIRGPELNCWRVTVAKPVILGALTLQPVVDFLQSAGKGQLLQQCEQAEKEIAGLLNQQQSLLKSTLEALTTYAAIVGQLPDTYIEQTRDYRWRQWFQELYVDFSVTKSLQLISQYQSSKFANDGNASAMKNALEMTVQLQSLLKDENSKIVKLIERIQSENNNENVSRLSSVDDSQIAIANYIEDQGKYGTFSLASVAISLLSGHCRRLGVMESAALAAGDRLPDYTSRDGDWFLDEIYILSANIEELISVLMMCREVLSPAALASFKSVNACHQVIFSLQELYLNFRTIILPEASKCIQRKDPTVSYIFNQLESLVGSLRTPLSTLVQQLELHVRNVVMEMEPPVSRANQLVEELKRKCQPLLEGESETESLSPGQMLLMGFNGLFTKLESDFWHFRECSLPIITSMPNSWRKVDVIREARSIMAPSFLDEAFSILSNIFFVKRLQSILEVYKLLQQHCHLLNGDVEITTAALLSEETIARPVKCLIAEFIGKMMLGLHTQGVGIALCHSLECCSLDVGAEIDMRDVGAESKVSVDDLCRKTMDIGLRRDLYQPTNYQMATSLLTDLERTWKRQTLINRFSQNMIIMNSVIQRGQLQMAQHQWLRENLLIQGPNQNAAAAPTRSQFISAIRKNTQSLMAIESSVSVSRERYLSLGNSVEQRLRWAAGANPLISSSLEDFERSLTAVNQLVMGLSKTSNDVTNVCGSILHLETMRGSTPEALTTDTNNLKLINRCKEGCLMEENCHSVVSTLEEKLLNVMPLEKHSLSSDWIKSVANCIAVRVVEVQSHLNQQKLEKIAASEAVKKQMMNICTYLATHHRLMNEVRSILKSMSKFEEQTNKGIRLYIISYKAFSEQFASLVKDSLAEEFSLKLVGSFLATVDRLKSTTNQIYDKLLSLSNEIESKETETVELKVEPVKATEKEVSTKDKDLDECSVVCAVRSGLGLLSATSQSSQPNVKVHSSSGAVGTTKKGTVIRDPRTGKAVQERNSYAVSVWKKVKMKLDGRDPDSNRRSTIPEQVDYMIKEATSLGNLATLYEGWTPWV
ncbi:Serine/threonine-protein kinase smg1 [Chamberlinius hualienensis]